MDSGGRDVTDMTMKGATVTAAETASRSAVLRRLRLTDLVFHNLTRFAALGVLVLLSGVIVALIVGAAPALGTFGFSFLFDESWNPVTEKFGALAPIYGTLITSAIAMVIAVPVGLMIAFFLTELCPPSLRRPIGIAIELLAGIPASSTASGACSCSRRSCRVHPAVPDRHVRERAGVQRPVRGPALRHRHADRGADPGDHGAALRSPRSRATCSTRCRRC
jgi:ABC-type Fe3+ transport system permease subunit